MDAMTPRATPEGTRRFAERAQAHAVPASAYRPLGRTGLVTSTLGFGTYRIDERTPEHGAALARALDAGVNLIDTSTNYTDGSSECAIGAVLHGRPREKVIVVSKVGYVQGQALALARTRENQGTPFPEMVKYMDGCWHCIHPDFLRDQLGRSLERLRLATIDVYLLHNPEYFFSDAAKRHPATPSEVLRGEFYDRMRRAFSHLEQEVAHGRIACYGVSSNTVGDGVSDPEATSIARMWTLAGEVAKDHHFAVLQLPANLYESGPVLERNNTGGTQSALDFAQAKGLAVLANRPLNAYRGQRLIRLAGAGHADIDVRLDPFLPEALRTQSLSRKAMATLVNTPGVTCVLNGMRRTEYVDDAAGVLQVPPFAVDEKLYKAFVV